MEKLMELKARLADTRATISRIEADPAWPWVDGMSSRLYKACKDTEEQLVKEIANAVMAM